MHIQASLYEKIFHIIEAQCVILYVYAQYLTRYMLECKNVQKMIKYLVNVLPFLFNTKRMISKELQALRGYFAPPPPPPYEAKK